MIRNQAGQYAFFDMIDTDGNAVTGLTPTVRLTLAGGMQDVGDGTVTEVGNGQYRYLFTQAETDTASIGFLATDAAAINAGFTIYPWDLTLASAANLIQIDGLATNGNNATLNLKMLNVVNNTGTAGYFESTGGNGRGVHFKGNGTSSGARFEGGATGNGAMFVGGSTSGQGINAVATNGIGVAFTGGGANAGFLVTGGVTGNAVGFIGGATSGGGLFISTTSGNGIGVVTGDNGSALRLQASGSGAAINAIAGATGVGMVVNGGATSGDAVQYTTTNGHGLNIVANGSGKYEIVAASWEGVPTPGIWSTTYADTQAILAALASAIIVTNNPVSETGITLVQGDSYTTAAGRALVWTIEDYSGPSVAGGTLTFGIVTSSSYGTPTATTPSLGPITGVAAMVGDDLVMTVELTAAQTATLSSGYPAGCSPYTYQLLLTTSDSQKITEQFGPVEVLKKII